MMYRKKYDKRNVIGVKIILYNPCSKYCIIYLVSINTQNILRERNLNNYDIIEI